jgi:hypothetical protein
MLRSTGLGLLAVEARLTGRDREADAIRAALALSELPIALPKFPTAAGAG